MAEPEVIEHDAPSYGLHGLQSRRKSRMYAAWNFEVAPVKRDKTHNGAQCLPCKHEAELKGIEVKDEGTCLADLQSILTHVKGCILHARADRQRAEAELIVERNKRKPANKRKLATAQQTDSLVSSSSNRDARQSGLQAFMALADKPLPQQEQKQFEQRCLRATVSANLPLSCSSSVAKYATEYYDRFFGSTADEKRQLYKHVASYLDKEGAFGTSIPNYQDPKEHPGVFWSLMRQMAPQLSKLAKHLFQAKEEASRQSVPWWEDTEVGHAGQRDCNCRGHSGQSRN
ncbi:TPA: hypothetical protein ACH3X1_005290 [Trebouxia sp. C0004]